MPKESKLIGKPSIKRLLGIRCTLDDDSYVFPVFKDEIDGICLVCAETMFGQNLTNHFYYTNVEVLVRYLDKVYKITYESPKGPKTGMIKKA